MGRHNRFFAQMRMGFGVLTLFLWLVALIKAVESGTVFGWKMVLCFFAAWLVVTWLVLSGIRDYGR